MSTQTADRPTVFVSYSHADEDWKDRVVGHLRALGDAVEVWDDRGIVKGDEWSPAIQSAMDRASVALLLVSKDFLTSSFIQNKEVPYLLKRRQDAGLLVIPVFVRPCAWQWASWAALQGCPKDAKALSLHGAGEADSVLAALAQDLWNLLFPRTPEAVPREALSTSPLLDLGRLPVTGSLLIGRETELARLDIAWKDPAVHVLVLVAFGGMGKSALVGH